MTTYRDLAYNPGTAPQTGSTSTSVERELAAVSIAFREGEMSPTDLMHEVKRILR